MPELPEAETIRKALEQILPGRRIENVEVFSPAMREPLTPLLSAGLPGRTFTGIRRRGRYLLADLDDGRAALMHFGMSGVVRVEETGKYPRRKHEHLFLHLSGGLTYKFECTRRFSIFKICTPTGRERIPQELAHLGTEPLSDAFCGKMLFALSRDRKTPVKNFIMDNRIVTGIGNIYATETLYAARISPQRCAGTLTEKECARITGEAKTILQRAIEAGGSSISDFLHVDGTEGKFAQELSAYGKCGTPCPRCGEIFSTVKIGGRSSCFCPGCQK
ncbi:MAG: bifunctional DNA-formamidopyrimidine glycosylase/DNA-(apurinic or apyrimidinic site) lyase [Lentisphaeria bacterium]|nr:bifunctional DNA-formamidopyrimidine glycosylase/DNA-(apurinic or apyrimidinic site) lyase [Lentisphaeria bacterium]MBQ9775469.1 bifunctional DNA-formamidopyrimidine glycosylase/DNA-(apurinic or apyrimidinic site) lyase [Lentisphaeria bacterium]